MPEVTTGSRGYKQTREQADKFLSLCLLLFIVFL